MKNAVQTLKTLDEWTRVVFYNELFDIVIVS